MFLVTGAHAKPQLFDVRSKRPKDKPYVVLVSIDGYRHDYPKLHGSTFFPKFFREGASKSLAMRPVYPSLTFPNHYSMVTGLYPERHGILANHFYNSKTGEAFSIRGPQAREAKWYKEEPIWTLLRKRGIKTASYFWPGSDVNIEARRPNRYRTYRQNTPNRKRVQQVLRWLNLPEKERLQFATLYFHDVDSAGHQFGPKSKEVRDAVRAMDRELNFLYESLQRLSFPVHLIIVSDHGMDQVGSQKMIFLSKLLDLDSEIKTTGEGGFMQLYVKILLESRRLNVEFLEIDV